MRLLPGASQAVYKPGWLSMDPARWTVISTCVKKATYDTPGPPPRRDCMLEECGYCFNHYLFQRILLPLLFKRRSFILLTFILALETLIYPKAALAIAPEAGTGMKMTCTLLSTLEWP